MPNDTPTRLNSISEPPENEADYDKWLEMSAMFNLLREEFSRERIHRLCVQPNVIYPYDFSALV
jgi:hypothetical protein